MERNSNNPLAPENVDPIAHTIHGLVWPCSCGAGDHDDADHDAYEAGYWPIVDEKK
jgi:hypothetical protein